VQENCSSQVEFASVGLDALADLMHAAGDEVTGNDGFIDSLGHLLRVVAKDLMNTASEGYLLKNPANPTPVPRLTEGIRMTRYTTELRSSLPGAYWDLQGHLHSLRCVAECIPLIETERYRRASHGEWQIDIVNHLVSVVDELVENGAQGCLADGDSTVRGR
jgi:hypothetical protein